MPLILSHFALKRLEYLVMLLFLLFFCPFSLSSFFPVFFLFQFHFFPFLFLQGTLRSLGIVPALSYFATLLQLCKFDSNYGNTPRDANKEREIDRERKEPGAPNHTTFAHPLFGFCQHTHAYTHTHTHQQKSIALKRVHVAPPGTLLPEPITPCRPWRDYTTLRL